MTDYIEREDAIEAMENRFADIMRTHKRRVTAGEKAIASDMIETAKMVKSADVAPVRHGHWEPLGADEWGRCSWCGCPDKKKGAVYCRHCGARMDKDGDD